MCGVAGFTGLKDAKARRAMVDALGLGIDLRGGHAAGYVSVVGEAPNPTIRLAKRVGEWSESSNKFRHAAAAGETCMMHSRFATCGKADAVEHAHPFAIKREGRTVLYGCHNGVLQGTYGSASKNKREHTVDSRELFELLADNDLAGIKDLTGYGVVTWILPGSPVVYLLRLSSQSDISCVGLVGGGIAWASTWSILKDALEFSGLEAEGEYTLPEIGKVYEIHAGMVCANGLTGVKLSSFWNTYGSRAWRDNYDDEDFMYGLRKDLSDEEIGAEMLLKEDEEQWSNMTGAEWERWGRWASKPPSSVKPTFPRIADVILEQTQAIKPERPKLVFPLWMKDASGAYVPNPANANHPTAPKAEKPSNFSESADIGDEWDRAYMRALPDFGEKAAKDIADAVTKPTERSVPSAKKAV